MEQFQYLREVLPEGINLKPSRDTLRHRIHRHHVSLLISCNHAIAHALEGRYFPSLVPAGPLVRLMVEERHFNRHSQLVVGEGLDEVAIWVGLLSSFEDLAVAIRRQIHERDVTPCLDTCRGFYSVHTSSQDNVHQDQAGLLLLNLFNRFLARRGDRSDFIAQMSKRLLKISRDDRLILDDEDLCLGHEA